MANAMPDTVAKHKYCPVRVDKLIAILEEGNSITCASRACGIRRETFYLWMNTHDEFRERVEVARAKAEKFLVECLSNQANKGNVAAIMFALKAQYGWKETTAIEHSINPAPVRTDEFGNEVDIVPPGGGRMGEIEN